LIAGKYHVPSTCLFTGVSSVQVNAHSEDESRASRLDRPPKIKMVRAASHITATLNPISPGAAS
jgi:hypothetical protein